MSNPAVEVDSLRKAFNGTVAVQDLAFAVERGEILAVLGPSGCGKTTLLRLIAGFERPDRGVIRISGAPMTENGHTVPPESRRVGMVFQNHALFPHLSVAENIGFGLPHRSGEEAESRVQHLLNLIRLPEAHDRYPHELSGGQRQRVAVARALAPEPVIILMDEPFSNLDADQRTRIRDEIRFILKQTETTVVFVTHDQAEALFMGDRLAVMRDGSFEQIGDPERVFRQPDSKFIATFLGHAEFLPATVEQEGLVTELGRLQQEVDLQVGESVDLGFRADDLEFEANPDGDAMVLARFFRGADCLYRLRLGSGRIVHSMQPHHRHFQPGTPVRVWFEPNHDLPCFSGERSIPMKGLKGASG